MTTEFNNIDLRPEALDIIGSVNPQNRLSKTAIFSAFKHPKKLARGTAFTGRNTTRVYGNEQTIVKLRTQLHFSPRDSRLWVEQALTRERELGVHHPSKSWFVAETEEGSIIGNGAPSLFPLNIDSKQLDKSARFNALEPLLQLYFSTAAKHDVRLDEGLSNFGFDASGNFYYIDDDLYPWDDFTSFSAALGAWLRAETSWCEPSRVQQLGSWIGDGVMAAWQDIHQLHVLVRQLGAIFMPEGSGREALEAISKQLQVHQSPRGRKKTKPLTEASFQSRFALLADIHANQPALEAVINDLDKENISEVLVLGDVVGYGPHPHECISLLRDRGFSVIQGNHDYGIATGNLTKGFSGLARQAASWTHDRLDKNDLEWLATLPPFLRQNDWMAVHGAPMDKQFFYGYVYHMTFSQNLDWMQNEKLQLAFHGHSHIAGIYQRIRGKDTHRETSEKFDLRKPEQALICPGSVGQPRGGKQGAEYALLDRTTGEIQFRRIAYDIEKVIHDMNALGLPAELALRLRSGQ